VNVWCSGGASYPLPGIPGTYDDAQMVHARLTVGGQVIYDKDLPMLDATPTPEAVLSYLVSTETIIAEIIQKRGLNNVRFASNNFTHNATATVQLIVSYDLKLTGVLAIHRENLTTTISPQVYNRSTVYANNTTEPGFNFAAIFLEIANNVVAEVTGAGIKHIEDHGTAGIDHVSKTMLSGTGGLLSTSTFLFAATHGMSVGMFDSLARSGDSNHFLSWGDITPSVNARGTAIPPHNMVFLYGCSMLTSPSIAASSFGISGDDRCVAGFDKVICSEIWSNTYNTETLNRLGEGDADPTYHASWLFTKLSGEGENVDTAIDAANRKYPPREQISLTSYKLAPMKYCGDTFSRLRYVYLTDTEKSGLTTAQRKSWYYIKPL